MDEVEQIKQKVDIVDLVSTYLTVKKAGTNYRALCPFHNEKTPSLMISPEKQIFKCFGCNEAGDIFSFVMKMENLEFREALEMLAERAGVILRRKYKEKSIKGEEKTVDRKTRLFRVNSICAQVYHKILLTHSSGKQALEYLHKRGIKDDTIKIFSIGYAPSSRVIKSYLLKKGFTEMEIQNAGGPDRFYKRIIFPITDVMGNVLGFTGRTTDKDQQPKYLNTPETIIFHKSRILFNLSRARGEIKLANTTVVVEGQMDVISSWQAGVKNVVASSGTALTEEHLQILYRYTPNIIFAFDSDSAGIKTSKRAFEMAISQGFNVKVIDLGKYKDPGEVCEENPLEWKKIVGSAKEVIDWYFDVIAREYSDRSNLSTDRHDANASRDDNLSSREKKEIADEILPVINKIPDDIERADYIAKIALKLELPQEIFFQALEKLQNNKFNSKETEPVKKTKTELQPEEILIGLIIEKNNLIEKVIKDKFIFKNEKIKKIYTNILKWYNQKKEGKLLIYLKNNSSPNEYLFINTVLLEIDEHYSQNKEIVFSDILNKLKKDKKELVKDEFAKKIQQAEKAGDKKKLQQLITDFQEEIKSI